MTVTRPLALPGSQCVLGQRWLSAKITSSPSPGHCLPPSASPWCEAQAGAVKAESDRGAVALFQPPSTTGAFTLTPQHFSPSLRSYETQFHRNPPFVLLLRKACGSQGHKADPALLGAT